MRLIGNITIKKLLHRSYTTLGLNHYDIILMQSDFNSKFLNLSQQLQQEKDERILLSRELFELSFLKVENELSTMSELGQKLQNLETKLQKVQNTEVLNHKIQSSIVIGAECNRIGKCEGNILIQRTYFSNQICLKACQKNTKCSQGASSSR